MGTPNSVNYIQRSSSPSHSLPVSLLNSKVFVFKPNPDFENRVSRLVLVFVLFVFSSRATWKLRNSRLDNNLDKESAISVQPHNISVTLSDCSNLTRRDETRGLLYYLTFLHSKHLWENTFMKVAGGLKGLVESRRCISRWCRIHARGQ